MSVETGTTASRRESAAPSSEIVSAISSAGISPPRILDSRGATVTAVSMMDMVHAADSFLGSAASAARNMGHRPSAAPAAADAAGGATGGGSSENGASSAAQPKSPAPQWDSATTLEAVLSARNVVADAEPAPPRAGKPALPDLALFRRLTVAGLEKFVRDELEAQEASHRSRCLTPSWRASASPPAPEPQLLPAQAVTLLTSEALERAVLIGRIDIEQHEMDARVALATFLVELTMDFPAPRRPTEENSVNAFDPVAFQHNGVIKVEALARRIIEGEEQAEWASTITKSREERPFDAATFQRSGFGGLETFARRQIEGEEHAMRIESHLAPFDPIAFQHGGFLGLESFVRQQVEAEEHATRIQRRLAPFDPIAFQRGGFLGLESFVRRQVEAAEADARTTLCEDVRSGPARERQRYEAALSALLEQDATFRARLQGADAEMRAQVADARFKEMAYVPGLRVLQRVGRATVVRRVMQAGRFVLRPADLASQDERVIVNVLTRLYTEAFDAEHSSPGAANRYAAIGLVSGHEGDGAILLQRATTNGVPTEEDGHDPAGLECIDIYAADGTRHTDGGGCVTLPWWLVSRAAVGSFLLPLRVAPELPDAANGRLIFACCARHLDVLVHAADTIVAACALKSGCGHLVPAVSTAPHSVEHFELLRHLIVIDDAADHGGVALQPSTARQRWLAAGSTFSSLARVDTAARPLLTGGAAMWMVLLGTARALADSGSRAAAHAWLRGTMATTNSAPAAAFLEPPALAGAATAVFGSAGVSGEGAASMSSGSGNSASTAHGGAAALLDVVIPSVCRAQRQSLVSELWAAVSRECRFAAGAVPPVKLAFLHVFGEVFALFS